MRTVYRVAEGAEQPHSLAVADVARKLSAGALALIPTETVYGIGVAVSAYREGAPGEPCVNGAPVPAPESGYARIFSLKRREFTQTVPWLVAGVDDLDVYGAGVPPELRALAEAFWPGALTIVVRASEAVPAFMRAADGTVALRCSASPVVAALVSALGCPLATTSANTHGAPAPAAFSEVEERVLDGVDVAVDAGSTSCRDASTIVSFGSGSLEILRHGALPAAEIERVLSQ